MKIIGVCGSQGRNGTPCLGPGGCEFSVSMDNAANVLESPIERQGPCCVRTWLKLPVQHAATVKCHHNHVTRLHFRIRDSGRLDDHNSAGSINPAHVAPCLNH